MRVAGTTRGASLRVVFAAVAIVLVSTAVVLANGTIDTANSTVAAGTAPQQGTVTIEPCAAPGPAPSLPSIGTLAERTSLGTKTGSIPAFPGGGTGALGDFHGTVPQTLPGGTYDYASFRLDREVVLRYSSSVVIRTTGDVVLDGQIIVDSGNITFECAGNYTVNALSSTPVTGIQTFGGIIKLDVQGALRFIDISPDGSEATTHFGTQGDGPMDFIARGVPSGAPFEFRHCLLTALTVSMRSATDLVIDAADIQSFKGGGIGLHSFGGDVEIDRSYVIARGPLDVQAAGSVVTSRGYLSSMGANAEIKAFGGSLDLATGYVQITEGGNVVCRAATDATLRNGMELHVVDTAGNIELTAFGGDVTLTAPPGNPSNALSNDGVDSVSVLASGAIHVDGGALVRTKQGNVDLRAFGGAFTASGTVTVENMSGPVDVGASGDVTAAAGGDVRFLGSGVRFVGDEIDLAAQLTSKDFLFLDCRGALSMKGTIEAGAGITGTSIDGDVTLDDSTITTTAGIGAASGDIRFETYAGARGGRIAARNATVRTGDHSMASGDVAMRVVTVPRPTVRAYLLPASVAVKLGPVRGAGLKAQGAIGCPETWLDAASAAPVPFTLDVGTYHLAGDLTPRQSGTDREFKAAGVQLRVSPSRTGNSKGVFSLRVDGDLTGMVPADGHVEFRLVLDGTEFAGTVRLTDGKFKLGSTRGSVTELLYPLAAAAQLKGPGKDTFSFTVGFASDGMTPATMPDLGIAFGELFTAKVTPDDFVRSGDRFTAKSPPSAPGLTLVVVDFDAETVFVKSAKLDLPDPPAGNPVPLAIEVSFGGDIRSVDVTLSRNGTKLAY